MSHLIAMNSLVAYASSDDENEGNYIDISNHEKIIEEKVNARNIQPDLDNYSNDSGEQKETRLEREHVDILPLAVSPQKRQSPQRSNISTIMSNIQEKPVLKSPSFLLSSSDSEESIVASEEELIYSKIIGHTFRRSQLSYQSPAQPLPPIETHPCPEVLQEKFTKWHDMMMHQHLYFNDKLESTHAFRNPFITSKLIEFLNLDEFGTHFQESVDQSGFYDALGKTS